MSKYSLNKSRASKIQLEDSDSLQEEYNRRRNAQNPA